MRDPIDDDANGSSTSWPEITAAKIAIAVWLLTALVQLMLGWDQILAFRSYDPDDSLRLVQIRDLLGGQPWWDVSQYRINPLDGGGQMHWSRIVDAPIAALILLLQPIVGQAVAERVATSAIPLLLLLGTMLAIASILSRVGNKWVVFTGLMLVPTAPAILTQLTALRIDHHGWQIMLSAALLALALGDATFRRGALAGLTAATLLTISLEGLPMVALFAVLFGAIWAWTGDRGDRARLNGYFFALGLGALVFQWATRGPQGVLGHWCDALSLPYLKMLIVAAIAVPLASLSADRLGSRMVGRLSLLAVVAIAAVATMALVEPTCLRGPFGALDPVVHDHWYLKIAEGLPLWRSEPPFIIYMLTSIIIGAVGTVIGYRAATTAGQRKAWAIVGIALAGATLVGLAVARSGATGQLFALPGIATLAVAWWQKVRSIRLVVLRVAASLLVIFFAPLLSGLVAMAIVIQATAALGGATDRLHPRADPYPAMACFDADEVRALNRLPRTLIFAPLDIGPNILRYSDHSVVATGHHRNNKIMAEVLMALRSTPADAEARVRATGATLVVICPVAGDIAYHSRTSPLGLAARLRAGQPVAWLTPVPMGDNVALKAWRIVPGP